MFKKYLEEKGDEYCAKLFKVKPRTVASWRRGERYPRPEQANEIVLLTNGEVTMNCIYQKSS